MGLEIPGETPQTFFKDRDVDAADKFVSVIDVEDQNARTRPALLLSAIGRAEVEVSPGLRFPSPEAGERKKNCYQENKAIPVKPLSFLPELPVL